MLKTKSMFKLFINILICVLLIFSPVFAQESDSSIYMDFRNQKIADIIYSVAEICGESVIIDETVTGIATFRFEDKNFESALNRFAKHCQLYVEKNEGVYSISKVHIEVKPDGMFQVNTEDVQIVPFLNMISRFSNRTILFDNLPNTTITIRVQNASLEDILNLSIIKLPGFVLERIADGFYITKSNGSINKRNLDVFTMSEVNGNYFTNIQKASLGNVIDTLFKKAKKEYSLLAKGDVQIDNISYSDKQFDDMLMLILEKVNCDYTVKNEIYYIYEIQKKDVVKKLKETKIIPLKYINMETFISLLPNELNASGFMKGDKNSNVVILNGSSSEINPIIDFIELVDVPVTGRTWKSFFFENAVAKDSVNLIPRNLLISDIILLPSANGFATQVTEESEIELSQFIEILDSKKKSFPVSLKYIKSEDLIKALPPAINKDNVTQTAEPSIIFFSGTDKQFKDFSESIKHIDLPKQQIKYQLLVIQRQKTKGFNWSPQMTGSTTDKSEGYSLSGMISNIFNINFDIISQFGVEFSAILNSELSDGKSRVLADTTLNGISGETLSFSNTNTFRYRDIVVDTKGEMYTSTTREIASGLILTINGWVSGDDMVTVKVDAQVSKQGSAETSSSANGSADTTNPPSTSEKKVSTNVRTKSGEPVIIGGLFQQEEDISHKRTPVLGTIPALGWLFKKRSMSMAETEFIIYLVPFVEKDKNEILSAEDNLIRLKNKYKMVE